MASSLAAELRASRARTRDILLAKREQQPPPTAYQLSIAQRPPPIPLYYSSPVRSQASSSIGRTPPRPSLAVTPRKPLSLGLASSAIPVPSSSQWSAAETSETVTGSQEYPASGFGAEDLTLAGAAHALNVQGIALDPIAPGLVTLTGAGSIMAPFETLAWKLLGELNIGLKRAFTELSDNAVVNIVAEMSRVIPAATVNYLVGQPPADHERYIRVYLNDAKNTEALLKSLQAFVTTTLALTGTQRYLVVPCWSGRRARRISTTEYDYSGHWTTLVFDKNSGTPGVVNLHIVDSLGESAIARSLCAVIGSDSRYRITVECAWLAQDIQKDGASCGVYAAVACTLITAFGLRYALENQPVLSMDFIRDWMTIGVTEEANLLKTIVY